MAALTTQLIADAGLVPAYVAASTSDTLEYGNGVDNFAHYKNGTASPVVVTIAVQGATNYGKPLPAATYTIPANGDIMIPLRQLMDNGVGGASGRATATVPVATSITVAVFKH